MTKSKTADRMVEVSRPHCMMDLEGGALTMRWCLALHVLDRGAQVLTVTVFNTVHVRK